MSTLHVYDVKTGNQSTIDITSNTSSEFQKEIDQKLKNAGFLDTEALIISSNPLTDWDKQSDVIAATDITNLDTIQTPDIPLPTSPTELPPERSEESILSTTVVDNDLHVPLNGKHYFAYKDLFYLKNF